MRQCQADPQTTTSAAASRHPSRKTSGQVIRHTGEQETNSNLTAKAISHQALMACGSQQTENKELFRIALALRSPPSAMAKTLSLLCASALMGFLMLKVALANAG